MTIKEQLVKTIETLNESDLEKVAEYLALLKSRVKFKTVAAIAANLSDEEMAALSEEFAQEDRQLAEEGMGDYLEGLIAEDECE